MDYRTERQACVVCGWLTYTRCPWCDDHPHICKGCMSEHIGKLTWEDPDEEN